eukprot:scaffold44742_cov16-Tisochrysis_lutea.AAC.1
MQLHVTLCGVWWRGQRAVQELRQKLGMVTAVKGTKEALLEAKMYCTCHQKALLLCCWSLRAPSGLLGTLHPKQSPSTSTLRSEEMQLVAEGGAVGAKGSHGSL